MSELKELAAEAKHELLTHIIPFWRGMRDDKFGGYYGYLSYDLALDEKAEKGCILNSRITWFLQMRIYFIKMAAFRKRNVRQQVSGERTC